MRINCLQVMILLCGVTMILLFGCIQQNTSSIEDRSKLGIDVGIKNVGKERIDLAYVRFGDYTFSAGIVSSGSKKVQVCSGQTVPDQAEVGYELANGKDIIQAVSVKTYMPTNCYDRIVLNFIVDGEQPVGVEFMHFVQVDGCWTLKHFNE